MDNFAAGEADAAGAPGPRQETMGAMYKITMAMDGRGAHEPLVEPYLMPPYHGRNGSNERTVPAITLTPLGGMMPGPDAIAPAIPSGSVGAFLHQPQETGGFSSGVRDGFPEGCPVPLR